MSAREKSAVEHQKSLRSSESPTSDGPVPSLGAFLSVKDAAQQLGVSYGSILGAIHAGSLTGYRFGPRGGTYRIAIQDLRDYVAARRTRKETTSPSPRKAASTFQKLDHERLLKAWRDQRPSAAHVERSSK